MRRARSPARGHSSCTGAIPRTRSSFLRRESGGIADAPSPRSFRAARGRHPILFDDRESRKNLATVESIARQLIKAGADRHATVVAVGGGVVGDVAGFAAATYLRGVRLVQIPTTLVAQVDSAVGGKTGVNLPEGKNLVGAFYPPKVVIADPALLATLPHREYRSGLYEVIKYGAIADPELFAFLERRMSSVLRRDPADLGWIISRSIAIKARVVSEDEREGGLRQILNFGHTLGHALEAATGYRLFLHGEAIGWGMVAASMMALSMDRLPLMDAFRIVRLIASVGPLPKVPAIPAREAALRFSRETRNRAADACCGSSRAGLARPCGESKSPRSWSREPCAASPKS